MWGRSGEVYGPEEVDKKDPNYDDAQVSLTAASFCNGELVFLR